MKEVDQTTVSEYPIHSSSVTNTCCCIVDHLCYTDKRFVQRYVIRDYDPTSANNLHVATSGPIPTKDSSVRSSGASGASIRGGPNRYDSSRNSIMASRRDSSQSSTRLGVGSGDEASSQRHRDIEITASNHYDTMQEMGMPVARRKTSLFDYGMKSD